MIEGNGLMQNVVEEDELEVSGSAASLARIQVRKSKVSVNLELAPAKAGDITQRLAALSAELDCELETSTSTTENSAVTTVDDAQHFAPRKSPERRIQTQSTSHPDQRRTQDRRRNTGWGQKKETRPDILSYWMDIRRSRRYPSWQTLEPEVIGKHWPNCILVHCNKELGRLQVKYEFTNAVRKATQAGTPDEDVIDRIEFTPMIVDWILGLGRVVASSGKPTHDTQSFPSVTGEYPLRVIALPLSDDLRSVDHVLCYIQQLK
ncbi:hypothetical protein A9Q83_17115 [Alphaproteobacteria bacterium 46_93_T64]|nr:hypothetical protein A9Q83_17115 [Alphaproteobacteria bacterium 46_93_T64]